MLGIKQKYFSIFHRPLLIILLLLAYPFLYKIYMARVNAFGCFDDCSVFMAGYFMLKGKTLYSQIFFNHQPLAAYISYGIQRLLNPINMYDLVLKHRQFVFVFGLIFNILLVLRYKITGFAFALFYEFSKFYVFGDRFLPEALIIYPIVYMIGVLWYKIDGKKTYALDYIGSGLFAWFVIFSREPYVPLAIFLYLLILWNKKFLKAKIISFMIFLLLSLIILRFFPIKDYIFNVFTVNRAAFANGAFSFNFVYSIFYPIFILGRMGEWNIFRYEIIGLTLIFLIAFLILIFPLKKVKSALLLYLVLILANLRPEPPGTVFYAAFHMVSWYASFLFITLIFIKDIYNAKRYWAYPMILVFMVLFLYSVVSPQSFIHERINEQAEYLTNYGPVMQVGDVVRALSKPSDTLFLDGFDDIIYWEAKRVSPYKYSWYTSFMPGFSVYRKARLKMFAHNPPDFYYGTCAQGEGSPAMPQRYIGSYIRLYSGKNPSCLYIKKQKLATITKAQWEKANALLYYLPKTIGK